MDKELIMRGALEEVLAQKDYEGFGEAAGRLVYVQAVADRALGRCRQEPHRILQRKIDSPKTEVSKPEVDAALDGVEAFAHRLCRAEGAPVPAKHYENVVGGAQAFLLPVLADARLAYIACRRPAELDFMEKARRLVALSISRGDRELVDRAWSSARESYLKLTKTD